MSYTTTISYVALTLLILLFMPKNSFSQKSNIEIVKVEFRKFPESMRNDENLKKSYLFHIAENHDSTLLYTAKFLDAHQSKDQYANFCHFFRGTSFMSKGLFLEAEREMLKIPESFVMNIRVKIVLGGIALQLEKYEEALSYLLDVESLPDPNGLSYKKDLIHHDIAICYLHLEKFEESERHLLKSLDLQKKKQDTFLLVGTYMDIANLYYVQYKDDQAIPYFQKAYALSKLIDNFTLKQNGALNMAIVEENRKDFAQSLVYRKEYEQWRDTLNDQNKIWEQAQFEKQLFSEKKEREIALLAKDNTIQKAQLNTLIYSSILLVLLLAGLLYFYLSKRKSNRLILSQKEKLDALNDTKDRLFSVVSHDLRSNVNALARSNSQITELVEAKSFENLHMKVEQSSEITGSIQGLLDNMLNWALLQTEQMYFQQENVSLAAIVNQTTHNYLALLKSKKIDLVTNIRPNVFAYIDIESLKIVLRNVLDNAIKFSGANDQVSIYSEDHSSTHTKLIVEDTGPGMDQSTLNELIKKIRSTSNAINQERTGLGLHLCHAMIIKNGGELNIESEENVGTKLILTLPLSQDYE